jgi:hypothetical protein
MKPLLLLFLVAALIVAAPGVADARGHGGHGSSHRGLFGSHRASTAHHSMNWHLAHLF